ncbi:GNAT family N-acetyltransferase [Devosia limi]|uniref:GNAT family N-acetyltransferase n=1 Tax=Devosia limi TaxID=288995 RepID=UPI00136490FD|nr:GNAT family N-acetyltransferase [Devosia limi]
MELRELQVADITPAYIGWMSDRETNRYLETRHSAQTPESVAAFVARVAAAPDEFLFGIFLPTGRHIGNIKVGPIRPVHGVADVSLLIGDAACRGQGFGTEAIRAVSAFAFDNLGVSKLSASMYLPNEGSTRAFLRAGFVREGLRVKHYDLDGERCDLVELGATREDMFKQKER